MKIEEVRSKLQGVHGDATRFKAKCPAHEDNRQSLSVTEKGDKILMHCFAGCGYEDIVKAMGLWKPKVPTPKRTIVATYDYCDENGFPIYQSVRYDTKDFMSRRDADGKWIWNLKGITRYPYRLNEWLNAETIFIVEGEKDVNNLFKVKIPATTNQGGSKNWKKSYDLAKWFAGKKVIICPDNDPPGELWVIDVWKDLIKSAASVRILRLPGLKAGGDVSDWLADGGTAEKFQELAKDAVLLEVAETDVTEPKRKAFDPEKIVATIELADWAHKEGYGQYHWNPSGYWERFGEYQLKQNVLEYLPQSFRRKCHFVDVLHLLSVKTEILGNFNERRDLINMKNGMFDFENGKLLPHDRDFHSTIQIPATWDAGGGEECPRWLKFLAQVLPDNMAQSCLQEYMGLCFTADQRFEKAALLYGKGQNGKSVIIETLQYLVGDQNSCGVSFSQLADKHTQTILIDKVLATCTEIPQRVKDTELFKTIVSGERIGARYLYTNQADFRPICKMIFAGNQLPKTNDSSYGYTRRFLTFPFDRDISMEERDLDLKRSLWDEADGIFHWCMLGLSRLRKEGQFSSSMDMNLLLNDYKLANNSILEFMEECLHIVDPDSTTENWEYTKVLYSIYEAWCYTTGGAETQRNLLSKFNFIYKLMRELGKNAVKRQKRVEFSEQKDSQLSQKEYVIVGVVVDSEASLMSQAYHDSQSK